MLTKPIEEILPISIDNKEVEELLNQFSNGIGEAVNYSTHIFKWCTEIKGDDKLLPVFMSFRHVIELLDAVSILIRSSSIDPCKLLLRGILESSFNILYILQKDTDRRAMCFLVWYYDNKLKQYEKLHATTLSGKQLRESIRKDRVICKMKIPEFSNISHAINNLKELLKKPLYIDVQKEYQKSRGNIRHWYSLFNGPKSLEQLANNLKLSGLYDILFRQWSGAVHGTDILDEKLSSDANGQTFITQIRHVKDAQTSTSISMSLILDVLRKIIDHYLPNKQVPFAEWYAANLRDFCLGIKPGKDLITIK